MSSYFNFLSLSLKLGETFAYHGFKVRPCLEESLCHSQVPIGFGERVASKVSTSLIFTCCVLVATALVGSRAGVGGARTRGWYKQGLHQCSVVITALLGQGQGWRELAFSALVWGVARA